VSLSSALRGTIPFWISNRMWRGNMHGLHRIARPMSSRVVLTPKRNRLRRERSERFRKRLNMPCLVVHQTWTTIDLVLSMQYWPPIVLCLHSRVRCPRMLSLDYGLLESVAQQVMNSDIASGWIIASTTHAQCKAQRHWPKTLDNHLIFAQWI